MKAVQAIIAAVEADKPPKHLVLGKMAYDRMEKRLETWGEELATWKETSLGADYDAAEAR